jgi:hypothetical protein
MQSKVYLVSKSSAANGAVLLMLAVYLAAVVYQGNVGAFSKQIWADFSGNGSASVGPGGVTVTASKGVAFWQWALASIVLIYLAENDNTSQLFGPLLAIVVVAMLIQLAEKQPAAFKALTAGVNTLFGGS